MVNLKIFMSYERILEERVLCEEFHLTQGGFDLLLPLITFRIEYSTEPIISSLEILLETTKLTTQYVNVLKG